MSLFPVTYSLLSKQAVGLHIQRNYEIGSVVKIQYFLRGMNDTYAIETDVDKYIFRIYRADRRSRPDIEFELELLRFLSANGISVSEPIPGKDGAYLSGFNVMEGTRYGVLFQYAEGHEMPIHAAADSYRFGESIGHMHKAADQFESRFARERLDMEFLINQPLSIIRSYMKHRLTDCNYLSEMATELKKRISDLKVQGLDWGVCHGDLHGNTNAAWTEDGKLTHYDFDLCGYGWRAYDIAEFRLAREIHSRHDPEEVERLWDAFLRGYCSVRSLSENDLAAVPVFVAVRQLWLFGLCFRDSEFVGIADFDEGFIDSKMQYFKRLEYV
ncbi:phosphotransferase [Paenibacillus sp. JNUCC32]|uniref:phosphotransferase n=1 Tax=Paenibacillus sp. JNUCC32 TaxID=2777984 RepID=UPI0017885154|nr:phosphotransferase [Paenibacillus sp. JNUCC-32]QOT12730.1 phosphotransferase [Paenibacillus sp. JNUCC-32]